MKINLVINNKKAAKKNFANISPYLSSNGWNKGDVHNLDWLADSASITTLIADDVLSRFTFPEIEKILSNWISKLSIGSEIILKGIDFEEVARALVLQQIDIQTAARLIYGDQQDGTDIRVSSMSCLDLVAFLEGCGLKITKKLFENYDYVIAAQRIS